MVLKGRTSLQCHGDVVPSSFVLTKSPDFCAWWGFLHEYPHEISSTSYTRKLQFIFVYVQLQCAMDIQSVHSLCQQNTTSRDMEVMRQDGGTGAFLESSLSVLLKFTWLEILGYTFQGKSPKLDILVLLESHLPLQTLCFRTQVPVLKTTPKLTLRCCGESGIFNH